MHETGIVRDLVRRLEAAAREAGAVRISGVTVRLGALSPFSPAHFREHFSEAIRGTLADGAVLQILASGDIADPHAQDAMVESMDLEVPEGGAGR
jgi:hydrogenase nickel incorporation protein HypA/HybF